MLPKYKQWVFQSDILPGNLGVDMDNYLLQALQNITATNKLTNGKANIAFLLWSRYKITELKNNHTIMHIAS